MAKLQAGSKQDAAAEYQEFPPPQAVGMPMMHAHPPPLPMPHAHLLPQPAYGNGYWFGFPPQPPYGQAPHAHPPRGVGTAMPQSHPAPQPAYGYGYPLQPVYGQAPPTYGYPPPVVQAPTPKPRRKWKDILLGLLARLGMRCAVDEMISYASEMAVYDAGSGDAGADF